MKILITGAASGIGFDTAVKLAKRNHHVYLTVHKSNQIKPTIEKYKDFPFAKNITCLELDIKKESDILKIEELDLDCLINNAAIGIGGSLLELPINKVKENFEVNVFSTLACIQTFAKYLHTRNKKGKIVIVSSLAGIVPVPFLGSYCATKASLISMATTIRRELRLFSSNIDIKLIEPGIYGTGFNDVMIENQSVYTNNALGFKDKSEAIIAAEKAIFHLLEWNKVDAISKKIVSAVESKSHHFVYRTRISQVLAAKMYMLLFK